MTPTFAQISGYILAISGRPEVESLVVALLPAIRDNLDARIADPAEKAAVLAALTLLGGHLTAPIVAREQVRPHGVIPYGVEERVA